MTSLVGKSPSKEEQQEIAKLIDSGTITSHLHLMNKLIRAYAFNFESYNMMPRSTSPERAVDVLWSPFGVLGPFPRAGSAVQRVRGHEGCVWCGVRGSHPAPINETAPIPRRVVANVFGRTMT
eukprot:1480333-Prymnesium_polylepis.1